MKETQKEFLTIMTNVAFVTDQTKFVPQGLEEVLREGRNRQVYARGILQIDEENLDETQSFNQKIQRKHLFVEIRHLDLGTSFIPRLVLRDEEEAVVFLTPRRLLMLGKDETGLWTNSKAVVYALKALFEELWQDSQPLSERINSLARA
jgi:hypothetical protein